MPRNRKLFIRSTPIMITSRVEEGLPFLPSVLINQIIWSALARARAAYQIKICHFVFMANHFHLLAVVEDPGMISHFVRYLKTETSHAVNRLLGRRKRTIWSEGYDSPTILTPEDVLRYIAYIYCNPSAARLASSIENYKGVSSWNMFATENYVHKCRSISRDSIVQFDYVSASPTATQHYTDSFLSQAPDVDFNLDPFAWTQCFPELQTVDIKKLKDRICNEIQCREKEFSSQPLKTTEASKTIVSNYAPKKFGRRMICLCSDPEHRKNFINWYRVVCHCANLAFNAWRIGDFSKRLPPGILAPGNFSLASINPALALA